MSKERELLEWALIFLYPHVSEEASNLHTEITELLATPEQERDCPDYEDGPEFEGWDKRSGEHGFSNGEELLVSYASSGIPRHGLRADLADRITEYLSNGGLFNPELANHAEVRNLLIDIYAGTM